MAGREDFLYSEAQPIENHPQYNQFAGEGDGQLVNTPGNANTGRQANLMKDIQQIMRAKQFGGQGGQGGGSGGGGGGDYAPRHSFYNPLKDPQAELYQRLGELRAASATRSQVGAQSGFRDIARGQMQGLEEMLYGNMFDLRNLGNQGGGGGGSRSMASPEYQDPYKDVRAAAIEAAMSYLNKGSPHLLSSLKNK
jgi:hypothetical protein